MTDYNINHLHPKLKPLALKALSLYDAKYPDRHAVRITITWRSPIDQRNAWLNGKSNAKPGQSLHEFMIDGKPAAKAFDYACMDDKGNYLADGTHPYYKDFAILCKSLGLKWGGDFIHVKPDYDHIELQT